MTLAEAKQYVSTKLKIDYSKIATNALFTDSELTTSIALAAKRAWDYRGWPFKEEALKITYSPPASGLYYVDYPNTYEDESVSKLKVNGLEWEKKNFDDFEKWFTENTTATDKLWANFQRKWFANKNSLTAGDEITLYGTLKCPSITVAGDLLPFSPDLDDSENSGNQAICRLALADLLGSEKKKAYTQATAEEKSAFAMLDALWAPMKERQSKEQSQDRPFFEVPDLFAGHNSRRSTNFGNFP